MSVPALPFAGLLARPLKTTLVEVGESVYTAGLTQPMHGHHPAYFTCVIAGAYLERAGAAERSVQAGALLFHPAGEEHAVRFEGTRTHVFRITLLNEFLDGARLAGARLQAVTPAHEGRVIITRMREAYRRGGVVAPLAIDALACELVACLAVSPDRRERFDRGGALRARDVIEAELPKTRPLEHLAQLAGCHPITLARAFRRTFGCSIGSYVRRRRLQHAIDLLQNTVLPISTVALRAGFADQPHLTRALRQAIGATPAALRAFKTKRPGELD